MTKKFKKNVISLGMIATLSLFSTTGIVANASGVSETVNLHTNVGAPGYNTVIDKTWNYTTAISESTINVSNFTASSSTTRISAQITVDYTVKSRGDISPSGGKITATNLELGKPATAYAGLNTSSGNNYATVSVSG